MNIIVHRCARLYSQPKAANIIVLVQHLRCCTRSTGCFAACAYCECCFAALARARALLRSALAGTIATLSCLFPSAAKLHSVSECSEAALARVSAAAMLLRIHVVVQCLRHCTPVYSHCCFAAMLVRGRVLLRSTRLFASAASLHSLTCMGSFAAHAHNAEGIVHLTASAAKLHSLRV